VRDRRVGDSKKSRRSKEDDATRLFVGCTVIGIIHLIISSISSIIISLQSTETIQ
jgi:hypothetical protein